MKVFSIAITDPLKVSAEQLVVLTFGVLDAILVDSDNFCVGGPPQLSRARHQ